jgi:hypothetical protein
VRIRLGYELSYQSAQPTPMILLLNVHPTRIADLARPDHMVTDPWIPGAPRRAASRPQVGKHSRPVLLSDASDTELRPP